jgi:hypothetical protein
MKIYYPLLPCLVALSLLCQNSVQASTKALDLPSVGVSLSYPESWTVINTDQLAALGSAVSKAGVLSDEMSKQVNEEVAALTGMGGVTIVKYPLSHRGPNPSFVTAALPLPPEASSLPREQMMVILQTMGIPSILGEMRAANPGMTVIEEPAVISGDRGVWFTVKMKPASEMAKLTGITVEQIARVYLFLAGSKMLMVTISYPADGSEKEAERELWEMVASMKF